MTRKQLEACVYNATDRDYRSDYTRDAQTGEKIRLHGSDRKLLAMDPIGGYATLIPLRDFSDEQLRDRCPRKK
jgi:hypothetical protein